MIRLRKIIGAPWAIPCNPPESFDCWELVVHARNTLGRETPAYIDRAARNAADRKCLSKPPGAWCELSAPMFACVARIGSTHVGVWLGAGQILHSQRGLGVRIDSLRALATADEITFWELGNG